jgi:hypothetical protein
MIYSGKNKSKWWNGYDAHETVVLDDYRVSQMKFDELLNLFDDTPYYVENKGGGTWFNSKNIIIATPKHPIETFKHIDEDKQLIRRLKVIEEFNVSQILDQELGNTTPAPDYRASLPMQ